MESTQRLAICPNCETMTLIPKSHRICPNCTCFKIHGVSLFYYKRNAVIEAKKKQADKPKSTVKYFSKKGQVAHKELTEVKKQIREDAFDNEEMFCQGCGRGGVGLDCSHSIPISQRSDLRNDKDNIQLLCRDCHNVWEHEGIKAKSKLLNFIPQLQYIYKNDEQRFTSLFLDLLDVHTNTGDKTIAKLITQIERF